MTPDRVTSSRRFLSKVWRQVRRVLLLSMLPLLGVGVVLYAKSELIVLGAEGYIYGYPLVITDVTRANAALTIGPENELHRVRQFPDASFKDVVRPNVDTLYTTAFIDTAKGPWVFEMAANDQRYEVMPFMDGWTNVFAAPGTRTTGKQGGKFLLVGPGWQGQKPPGLTLMQSPTQMVWLIGRTQTNGVADYGVVHRLQDGVTLKTLNDWQAGKPEPRAERQPSSIKPVPAPQQMQAMGAQAFFTRLALLMASNPPTAADGPMVAKLARIGIAPGQPPHWSLLDRWTAGASAWAGGLPISQWPANSENPETRREAGQPHPPFWAATVRFTTHAPWWPWWAWVPIFRLMQPTPIPAWTRLAHASTATTGIACTSTPATCPR